MTYDINAIKKERAYLFERYLDIGKNNAIYGNKTIFTHPFFSSKEMKSAQQTADALKKISEVSYDNINKLSDQFNEILILSQITKEQLKYANDKNYLSLKLEGITRIPDSFYSILKIKLGTQNIDIDKLTVSITIKDSNLFYISNKICNLKFALFSIKKDVNVDEFSNTYDKNLETIFTLDYSVADRILLKMLKNEKQKINQNKENPKILNTYNDKQKVSTPYTTTRKVATSKPKAEKQTCNIQ